MIMGNEAFDLAVQKTLSMLEKRAIDIFRYRTSIFYNSTPETAFLLPASDYLHAVRDLCP